mmetsp:Transcript_15835/g.34262  ORF Transcript_15835/g.34262 Transcript_15835/m.34262 type:complete len:202 (-) Transcript_15835:1213-1818(-)
MLCVAKFFLHGAALWKVRLEELDDVLPVGAKRLRAQARPYESQVQALRNLFDVVLAHLRAANTFGVLRKLGSELRVRFEPRVNLIGGFTVGRIAIPNAFFNLTRVRVGQRERPRDSKLSRNLSKNIDEVTKRKHLKQQRPASHKHRVCKRCAMRANHDIRAVHAFCLLSKRHVFEQRDFQLHGALWPGVAKRRNRVFDRAH